MTTEHLAGMRWAAGLVAILLSTGCGEEPRALEERNKALVRRYLEEVVSTGELDALDRFVSPDYVEVHENVRHPMGLDGARAHVLGVRAAFPDLAITVEQQLAEGEWVVSRITARGTHRGDWLGMRPTGQALVFTGVNVDRVVDGRIVEHGGAANLLGPLLSAGAVEIAHPVADD